jgi:hypothetical protein
MGQTNLGAKHSKDLTAFVVYDGLLDFVIQDWYAESGLVVSVSLVIDLS